VLDALKEGPLQAKDICLAADLRNRNAADQLLFKMTKDGEIVRAGRGLYSLPDAEAGKIDKKERLVDQPIELTTETPNLTDLTDLTGAVRSAPPPTAPESAPADDPWHIPPALDRRPERLGAPAISAGVDDDLGDI
jgi:hypothetical protein